MRRKMRARVIIAAFGLSLSIAATLFAMATYAGTELPGIPPLHQIDVITRENDLLLVTSNWPESFTIENRSSKNISGFQLSIMAAEDEGGPMRYVRWGFMPQDGKLQTDFLEPKEKITVLIEEEIVDTFVKNGKSLIYVQQAHVWADNDFTTLYSFGKTLKQDPKNPKQYVVIREERHSTTLLLTSSTLLSL